MTRVYLVNVGFRLAGVERRFANLWRALRARGRVEPILVIPRLLARNLRTAGLLPGGNDGIIEIAIPSPIEWLADQPVFRFGQFPRAVVQSQIAGSAYRSLWRRLTGERDVVLHMGMPCRALRPPDFPAVYECMDATFASFPGRYYRRASTRRIIVHCQTERIRRGLSGVYAGHATAWRLVRGANYFADYPALDRDAVRDPRQVVFSGRLDPIKNPLLFIEGVALVRGAGVDCRAVMLGEGPMQSSIEEAIRRHRLGSSVEIRFDPHPGRWLSRAAVYVSLQNGDNYGSQALLEAMGAGCAVIASNVGETGRLVTPDVGTTVPLDPAAFADALIAAISDPEETRRRGARAAQVARSSYTADAYAASLESLYAQAIDWHRGKPAMREEATA